MSHDKSYNWFKIVAGLVLVASVVLLILAAVFSGLWASSNQTLSLLVLFFLPVLVQICGLKSLDTKFERAKNKLNEPDPQPAPDDATNDEKAIAQANAEKANAEKAKAQAVVTYAWFYLVTMGLCLCVTNGLWIVYAWGQGTYQWEGLDQYSKSTTALPVWENGYFKVSIFAVGMAAVLLAVVMWMTRAVISGEVPTSQNRHGFLNLYKLRLGASQAPFLTLIFFLTVFLGVSYLFGFAFAFHDKTHGADEPALVMRNQVVPQPSMSPSPRSLVATFEFDSGQSTPTSDVDAGVKNAIDHLIQFASGDNPVRVTIEGGADLKRIDSVAYQSNYELAGARSESVKQLLLQKLSTEDVRILRDIQWTCLSKPKEGKQPVGKANHKATGRNSPAEEDPLERKVEVFLEQNFENPASMVVRNLRADHLRPLNLMDYIYFANYTITTTGYGDIVPNTNYAKFICSFANIAEVFFLVVFFNTLLSLVGRQSSDLTSRRREEKMGEMSTELSSLSMQLSSMSRQIGDLHNKYGDRKSSKRATPRSKH